MVKVYNDGSFITIELNNSNNVLQKFYSVDYFDLIGIQPDIYVSYNPVMSGGYFQDTNKLTVPYKYLVKFLDNKNNITAEIVDNNLSVFNRGYEKLVSAFNGTKNKNLEDELGIEPKIVEPEPVEMEEHEPETVESEELEPETVEPEIVEPETVEAEIVEPETVEPEIVEPETVEPETVEPEGVESEIVEPETVEPEIVEPETVEPETVEPETVEPETVEPEIVEPETVEPEIVEPETVEMEETKSIEPEVVIEEKKNEVQKLILKFRIEPGSIFNGSLKEVMDYNIKNYSGDIELNTNGLFYNDIVKIYEIRNFINMNVNQIEVYRINGKFIVIKEFLEDFYLSESIDELDVSMMENTYLTKHLRINNSETESNFI
jgi:hypothetical protein